MSTDGPARPEIPPPGAIAWLDVSADSPPTLAGRAPTGPLGMRIAPLQFGRAAFFLKGARLRGTRCIWSASTVSGAELVRGERAPAPTGFDGAINILARVEADGSVFAPTGTGAGAGVMRVFESSEEIVEQFADNTHLYTLSIPPAALGIESGMLGQLRGEVHELSTFQVQVLRAAVGLVQGQTDELVSASSLIGLDRYLAALAGLLLRTSARRPAEDPAQVESIRARTDSIIYEQSDDPEFGPAAIADQLAISLRQLYRAFHGVESPASRIRRRRLERAAEILAARPGTVGLEKIANECGFESVEYFSRAFRREFGLSPRSYRSAHRDGAAAR